MLIKDESSINIFPEVNNRDRESSLEKPMSRVNLMSEPDNQYFRKQVN